jgi:hypothetical protein
MIKNLVYLAFLALVLFGIAGYFLNWYQFTNTTSSDGKRHIAVDVNEKKIEDDAAKGKKVIDDLREKRQGTGSAGDTRP